MQIVIDISEDMYNDIIDGILDLRDSDTRIAVGTWLNRAVPKSTVLPDGHGRLIDADKFENFCTSHRIGNAIKTKEPVVSTISPASDGTFVWDSLFDYAPTLLEGTNAGSN